MNRTSRLSLAACTAMMLIITQAQAALFWDAGQNLVTNELVNGSEQNPNPVAQGVWSYGSKPSPTSTNFVLFPYHMEALFGDPAIPGWHGGEANNTPGVSVNVTNVTLYNIPPQNLLMHPGSNRMAVLRFTPPGADLYNITFAASDSDVAAPPADGVSIYITLGTSIVASASIPEGGKNTLSTPVTLASAQVLDFVVDYKANFQFDSTAVSVTVQRVIGTPAVEISLGDGRRWITATNTSEGLFYSLEEATDLNPTSIWSVADQFAATNRIQSIGALPGATSSPAFVRVRLTSIEPPKGMSWIQLGDAELGQAGIAEPVHTNYVSSFWMDATEVTKAKWDEVYNWATNNGYTFENAGSAKTNNHPVVNVNWYDCIKWCNARSQKEQLSPCYFTDPGLTTPYKTGTLNISNDCVQWSANGYRLPTESEWEKAARGGWQGRLFPWGGDMIQHARANYCATNTYSYDTSPTLGYHPGTSPVLPRTLPVGSFEPNAYGLYDMAGNAFEWVWDWYGDYSATYQTDARGPITGQYGVLRMVRGGSCFNFANVARSAYRYSITPVWFYHDLGLRCVRNP